MRRRDFLLTSVGLAGGAIPIIGQAKPCPPPQISANGGSAALTTCGVSPSQLADWVARSTGAGVVWAHNFDTAAEVGQFRNVGGYGIDPNNSQNSNVTWNSGDGFAGGGSLKIAVGKASNASWWRPFSPIRANDNGRTVADAAAGGTFPLQSYDSNTPSVNYNWRKGYFANPAEQAANPIWPPPAQGGSALTNYLGTDFYLQFRCKISGSRWATGNPDGKLTFIDVTGVTGYQEIVVSSLNNPFQGTTFADTMPFRMYTAHGGGYANEFVDSQQSGNGGASFSPNSPPYEATCTIGGTKARGACWEWPRDEWVTILVHVIPGRDNINYTNLSNLAQWPYHDHGIQVYVAHAGQFTYTKVFDKLDLCWWYETSQSAGQLHPPAFNAFAPSGYMNGVDAVVPWVQSYTQIILSKNFIPCPQV